MNLLNDLKTGIIQGDFRILARALTLVENDIEPASTLLKLLQINTDAPVLGITGPPGAGKSTLVNAITANFVALNKKIAILAIDPTSPFNFGALLGDRIRMVQQFNNPNVFIRSVATRGNLGGVSAKTLAMVDVLKASNFDLILIETVGVGQSEVEIAGLAEKTVVVLVPESGDEIQNIKSGLMEIAQAFVVNKADRDGATTFANNLKKMVHQYQHLIPVFKTVAHKNQGITELCNWLITQNTVPNNRKTILLAEKAFQIIQHHYTKTINKEKLIAAVKKATLEPNFNVYDFAYSWIKHS